MAWLLDYLYLLYIKTQKIIFINRLNMWAGEREDFRYWGKFGENFSARQNRGNWGKIRCQAKYELVA
jgi:hypothetical protein